MRAVFLGGHLGVFIAVHAHKRVGTVLAHHGYSEILLSDGEGQGLLAIFFQRLYQQFSANRHFACALCVLYIQRGADSGLAV